MDFNLAEVFDGVPGNVGSLPDGPGAYLLLIEAAKGLRLPKTLEGGRLLVAGTYLYAGSAYGPGGIRARVHRHQKRKKTIRWHVDRLTVRFGVAAVLAWPGGRECDLVDKLTALDGVSLPVSGFGSSDCRRCRAHLLELSEGVDGRQLSAVLGRLRNAVRYRPS